VNGASRIFFPSQQGFVSARQLLQGKKLIKLGLTPKVFIRKSLVTWHCHELEEDTSATRSYAMNEETKE